MNLHNQVRERTYQQAFIIQDPFLWQVPTFLVRDKVNEAKIKNLFILEIVAQSTVKAVAAQQRFLEFLAKAVLGNKIAPDNLLAGQGVCTFCCIWINTSQQVELETTKLLKLAKSLRDLQIFPQESNFVLSGIFSWFSSGLGVLLHSDLQVILLVIKLIWILIFMFKLFIMWIF